MDCLNSTPTPRLILQLWRHIGSVRRKQFVLLALLTFISALAEVVSLGAVLPFIGILVAPEDVFNHEYLKPVWAFVGFKESNQLALPLTLMFVSIALIAGMIRLSLLWISTRFAFSCGADLSLEVYKRTLYQPYEVHVSRNSSEVVSGIITKVNEVVFWVLLPLLKLMSSGILLVAIVGTLIFIDPLIAISSILGFGLSYGFITIALRKKLNRNAGRIAKEQTQVVKALQEGLGGIRDVLLNNTQQFYCDIYKGADRPLRKAYGSNIFIGESPRFAMEALGMSLLAALAYFMSVSEGGINSSLPVLGALALGAQRLLPALQQSYSAWSSILGCRSSLIETVDLLGQKLDFVDEDCLQSPMVFKSSISFENVSYSYNQNQPLVIKDISFDIKKGERVGIVGSTGSGKSTLIDLLMGLLMPTQGSIKIDGIELDGANVRGWKKQIGHVPQDIYLSDATIAENVAFGEEASILNKKNVLKALDKSQLLEFIQQKQEKLETFVGERGIKLSGGQRQRIGIARALYKDSQVLVFDEATSALDNRTEKEIISAIEKLDKNLTIIAIAHRLSTLRFCDKILHVEGGRLKSTLSYDQVLEKL